MRPLIWSDGELHILDQRALPGRVKWIRARRAETVAEAIESLAVRGAPLIGITAAYGVALEARRRGVNAARLHDTIERLRNTRPTGYNLFFALAKMEEIIERGGHDPAARLFRQARKLHRDDARACLTMARQGVGLMRRGERVLTYCNTGALATGGIGTALGVIKLGYREGRVAEVFACETRPVGQGARLTAWECAAAGIPVTVICDNMAAALMSSGRVDRVFVGADRIARNGDTSNKIGTFQLAVTAKAFRIPFHVVAPLSTFDTSLSSGRTIPIEERDAAEVTRWISGLDRVHGVQVWNPSFDVTPVRFIAGHVTEQGVLEPPFVFQQQTTRKE
ncbi:S-methyl-5-thioribose-1-phosphate isomerase [bacterium]|nr:S-methyl-5-thioribose-1-phosphate isomerase [bacterium]MBU1983332.1 S-methyl-5-thioribose-1-phosphate isomerase [bacterium]